MDLVNPAQALDDVSAALVRIGLLDPNETPRYTPLTGGVASDIWKVETSARTFAVKRALAKLRVAQDWYAPVSRNAFEVKWMRTAGLAAPDNVPEILGHDAEQGLFAMAYLDPAQYRGWKTQLRDGVIDSEFAADVGRRLARIHASTANDASVAQDFPTDETFHAIRLEPYLEATAKKHRPVAGELMELSRQTLAIKKTLVHGDVSPKNILVGPRGPVFLDAECAWFGDPAFDLAFCLNHLLLKCLWRPQSAPAFLAAFDALAGSYLPYVGWEPRDALEARAAHLLPGLFLARVDGKSPVEYLTEESDKARVRRVALPLIAVPRAKLADIRRAWGREVGVKDPA